jgi:hypothetical protein
MTASKPKKLALVETCVADLRRLARPDALAHDLREDEVDLAIVKDVVEHRLDDLLDLVVCIRRRLAEHGAG